VDGNIADTDVVVLLRRGFEIIESKEGVYVM
jgi:hypothetical protein